MWFEIATIFFYIILVLLVLYFILAVSIMCLRLSMEPFKSTICKCQATLEGKIVLVTGGISGIGFQTAKGLALRGARVIIADINDGAESVNQVIAATGNKHVEYRYLNLADFKSIRAFAENFNRTVPYLDILVNNAGCLTQHRQVTEDGIDMIMQVNYFGPFLLTHLVMEKLLLRRSRIVTVASALYQKGEIDFEDLRGINTRHYFNSYMNSKLCTVLWTKAMSKKLPDTVSAFCLHPGMVSTNIMTFKNCLVNQFMRCTLAWTVKSPFAGAQTSIHVCLAPDIDKYNGGYFVNCKLAPYKNIPNEEKLVEDLWNETSRMLIDQVVKLEGHAINVCKVEIDVENTSVTNL